MNKKRHYFFTAFILGIFANLSQIALFRFFIGNFYGTEIHLGLFLGIWLAGISAGGYFGGKFPIKPANLIYIFLFLPAYSLLVIYFGVTKLPITEGGFLKLFPVTAYISFATIPISFFIGTIIPSFIFSTTKKLGEFYAIEALGSFLGGIIFSLLLGGNADSIQTLLVISLFPAICIFEIKRTKLSGFLCLFIPILVWQSGTHISEKIEQKIWKRFHPVNELTQTIETPYQKIQTSKYYGQKSLFSNGIFCESWPLAESVEQKVHSFVTNLKNFNDILVIGAPPPDFISELLKYKGANINVLELDKTLFEIFQYPVHKSLKLINEDPRSFLNQTEQRFDGIMIYPVSPVTLVGNRLFTFEAIESMKKSLKPDGVLSLQVSGTENYLGSIKEQIILSTNQTLKANFSTVFAFPGNPITFFATNGKDSIPGSLNEYMDRFASRNIIASTFYPQSFFNLLMPFRVKELEKWLQRDVKVDRNTDSHPGIFKQQIELWNIYSGEKTNKSGRFFATPNLNQFFKVFFPLLILVCLFCFYSPKKIGTKIIVPSGVLISGATGILSEIILILLYQNKCGAAFQMSALFFGLYMLGLSCGAYFYRHHSINESVALVKLKLLQTAFALSGILFVELTEFHSALWIGTAIFIIAFLDGIEFPVADSILKQHGKETHRSAGILMFMDNSGALATGILSGLWFLPVLGMKRSFTLLFSLLLINAIGIGILTYKKDS